MAFTKMINGAGTVRTVPGSVIAQYERMGYTKYNESKAHSFEDVRHEIEPENIPAVESDVLDKPLAEWTKEEMKEYALANNIDLSSAKKVTEVREIIRTHMEG